MAKMVGLSRNLKLQWLNKVVELVLEGLTEQEIKELNLDIAKRNKSIQEKGESAIPKINIVISSYYKGTALEEVLKRLEEYLDNAPANESDITNI